VNSVSYVLSSYQFLEYPSIINHYLFVDPVFGSAIVYPDTATGSIFSETTGSFVYPTTADGGLFFPWGYPIYNTTLSADLGTFKGITTLTVNPSAIDDRYYAVMKILYDFEGDYNIINIEKGIVQNVLSNNVAVLDPGSPKETIVSHIFTPKSLESTTYYPTITVVNGNLSLNVFNLKLTLLPDTIFKFDDFHLINTSQLTRSVDKAAKSLEVFEIDADGTSYVSNFLLLSATSSQTVSSNNIVFTPTPTPSITPTLTPTPTVTPTATPTPSVTPSAPALNEFLFDKSSFIGIVSEPFLTYLNAAVDRWETYIRMNPEYRDMLIAILPSFNGIGLNSYSLYNDPASNTIASCGISDYYYVDYPSRVDYGTLAFNLSINDRYPAFSAQDWINVLTHELGHALGIGIYWSSSFTSYYPQDYFLDGTYYPLVNTAYDNILGATKLKIALENTGGSGTSSAHWENDFRSASAPGSLGYSYPGLSNELMVGYFYSGLNLTLSDLSIKTLVQFGGYEEKTPGANEGPPGLVNSLQTSLEAQEPITRFGNCSCSHVNGEPHALIGYYPESNEIVINLQQ
jgi:hypothetical protein